MRVLSISINLKSPNSSKLYLIGNLNTHFFAQIVHSLDLAEFEQTISILVEDFWTAINLLLIMLERSSLCHFKAHNLIFPKFSIIHWHFFIYFCSPFFWNLYTKTLWREVCVCVCMSPENRLYQGIIDNFWLSSIT